MTTHVARRSSLPVAPPVHVPHTDAVASTAGSPHPLKRGLWSYLWHGDLPTLLIAPIIYSLVVPLILLDLWATAYQWICFPVLRIALVRRRSFFVLDRHKLAYLNVLEKANCTFCSYANGVIGYVREIQARTELYWCPIKHGHTVVHPHGRYGDFFEYDDAAAFRRDLAAQRRRLR